MENNNNKFIRVMMSKLNNEKTTAGEIAESVKNKKTNQNDRYISIWELVGMIEDIEHRLEEETKHLMPKTKFLYVEDGSVDFEELESSLFDTNPEIKVVVYRQGSAPPILSGEDKRRG